MDSLGSWTCVHFRGRIYFTGCNFLYVRFRLRQRKRLLLFYGATLSSWLGFLMGSYSLSGPKQVSLRSILYGVLLFDMCSKISVQFGGIAHSLMNGTVKNLSSNTTWNLGETWPVSGFRTRDTDPAWNGEWPRYIHSSERFSHLVSLTMLPWNIAYNT